MLLLLCTMEYSLIYSLHPTYNNMAVTSTASTIVLPAGFLVSSGIDQSRKQSLQLLCVEVRNPGQ